MIAVLLLSHLEDTVSPGPTALSPSPRYVMMFSFFIVCTHPHTCIEAIGDRAKREAKGPVLFSDPEDAEPATQRFDSI